ncbi:MAG: peptidylprolyl isomerase, partial [Gammaproteobacteria bacterium]
RIIAVVNDDVIMQSELKVKLRTVISQLKQQGTTPPPAAALERQILDRLILTKLQLQLADDTGVRIDDETLNRTISNIASENKVTLTQFREILESDGYNYEQFREDIRNEITVSRLRQRHVDNRVAVTDREINNFITTQKIQGNIETEHRIAHILIATPEAASPEESEQTKHVAQKVLNDLDDGQDFAELATTISDGQQALKGGDLGWRKHEQIPTLFTDYIGDMKEGDISELIQSPSGFHIIKLTGYRSSEKHVINQTHVRHILLRSNELTSDKDNKIRMEQLETRIKGGDDFAVLARSHSDDPISAAKGGDLGWVNPGDLVPRFEGQMNRLEPGETSEPFKTEFGLHIIQVLARREHDDTEDVKRSKARQIIRQRKIEEAHQNWLRHMRDEAYVEYRLDDY